MTSSNHRWMGYALGLLGLAAMVFAQGCIYEYQKKPRIQFNNKDFYDNSGKFNEKAAKQAYIDLLKYHGYPMLKHHGYPTREHGDELQKMMWVTDFGLGKFTDVGMGGVFWVNDQKNNYTGLDMFLLPSQMIPEHWHVQTDDAPVKMESWHCRWGTTYTYGEGPATKQDRVAIPPTALPHTTVLNEKVLRVGEVTGITQGLVKHWQIAGPVGAIVTEYSTYHSGKAVRFTDPRIKF